MVGRESGAYWGRPKASPPSLAALPGLAQERILIHCSSADLAALRCCSFDHRRMVDRAVTRLFPWIVVTPAGQSSAGMQPRDYNACGDIFTWTQTTCADVCPTSSAEEQHTNPVELSTVTTHTARIPPAVGPITTAANATTASVGTDSIDHVAPLLRTHITRRNGNTCFIGVGTDSGPFSSLSELILRHHPHLDRCLDPSSASYCGDSGQHHHISGGLGTPQLQTIHLPCRLRAGGGGVRSRDRGLADSGIGPSGLSCLAAMPSLTSLCACMMCVVDVAAARLAARANLGISSDPQPGASRPSAGQGWASSRDVHAASEAATATRMSRSAVWLAEQHRIRIQQLKETQLVRQTEECVDEQITASIRHLPSLAPRLAQLTLTDMPFVAEAFQGVSACPGLTHLVLSARVGDRGLSGITAIAAAAVGRPGTLMPEHLNALVRGLPRLRHLDLHAPAFFPSLDFGTLAALTGLTYLRLNQGTLYERTYGNRFERIPSDFLPQPLLGQLCGIARLAELPQLHSLSLTGLDSPPRELFEALPPGGGPLRLLALRKLYRVTADHLNVLGALTRLTELQLSADWFLQPGSNAPAPLDVFDLAEDMGNGPVMMVEIDEDFGVFVAQAANGPAGAGNGGGGAGGGLAAEAVGNGAVAAAEAAQQEPPQQDPIADAELEPLPMAAGEVDDVAGPGSAATTSTATCAKDCGGEVLVDELGTSTVHGSGAAGPSASQQPVAAAAQAADADAAVHSDKAQEAGLAQPPVANRAPDAHGREERSWGQSSGEGQVQDPQPMDFRFDVQLDVWNDGPAVHMQQEPQEQGQVVGNAPAAGQVAGPDPPPLAAQVDVQEPWDIGLQGEGQHGQVPGANAINGGGWVLLPGAALLFGGLPGPGGAGGGAGGVSERATQQQDERLAPLRRLQNLQVLHLGVGRIFNVVNLGPRFLEHLSAITSLTSISLRCTTVDWGLLSVLAPLPRLAHVSMHYYDGRGNDGKKIAANLLTWHNLSAVTTLHLGAFEARHDADIITRVLPRTRLAAASIFGMRSCRPGYDVFAALAQTTTLTNISVQGDWMIPRSARGVTAVAEAAEALRAAPGEAAAAHVQTLSELRRLPLLRSLTLDLGSDNVAMESGVPHGLQDVFLMMAGMGQPGGGAAGGVGFGAFMGPIPMPPPPPPLPPLLPPLPLPAELPQLMLPLPPAPPAPLAPAVQHVLQLPPAALPPLEHAQQQQLLPPPPPRQPRQQLPQQEQQDGSDLQGQGMQQQQQQQAQMQQRNDAEESSPRTVDGQILGCLNPSTGGPEMDDPTAAVPPTPASLLITDQPSIASPAFDLPVFQEVPVQFEATDSEDELLLKMLSGVKAAMVTTESQAGGNGGEAVAAAAAAAGASAPVEMLHAAQSEASPLAASRMGWSAAIVHPPGGRQDTAYGSAGGAAGRRSSTPGAGGSGDVQAVDPTRACPMPLPPVSEDDESGSGTSSDPGSRLGFIKNGTGSESRLRSAASSGRPRSLSPTSRAASASGHGTKGPPGLNPTTATEGKPTAQAVGTAAATVTVPELSASGRWLLQVSELTQLTSLRLERWPAAPPAALAPMTALRRLQMTGLRSLEFKLLKVLSRLPMLTYLTLEGQARAHIGSSVYRTLTRTPYIHTSSAAALGTLTQLRLLILSGFSLLPSKGLQPQPEHQPQQPPRQQAGQAAAAWRNATSRSANEQATAVAVGSTLDCVAESVEAAAAASEPDGRGPRTSSRRQQGLYSSNMGVSGDVRAEAEAEVQRLLASLGRLQALRYLSLCIAECVEASDVVWLCGLLPGLRMLNLPADAPSRTNFLRSMRRLHCQTSNACSLPATGRVWRGQPLGASGPSTSAGWRGSVRRGERGGEGDTKDGNRSRTRGGVYSEPRLGRGAAGPSESRQDGAAAAAAGSGGGGSSSGSRLENAVGAPEPPAGRSLPSEKPFAEQLEGLHAAVYSGLNEGEFWRVVDGLDVEIRAEGALLNG